MPINKCIGLLLSAEYKTNQENKSLIHLYVKTSNGIKEFIDLKFNPYYYVKVTEIQKALKELNEFEFNEIKILKTEIEENKKEKNLIKIYFNSTSDLTNSREKIKELKTVIELHEMDILFPKRYLLDKNLTPLTEIELIHEKNFIKSIKEINNNPLTELNLIAFDLETHSPGRFSNPELDPILTISIYSKKIQKVITYKKEFEKINNTIIVENEKKLIQKFIELIQKEKPDALITYNGDSFDLPYLKERAKKFKLKLSIGFNETEPKTKKISLFTAEKLLGVQHLDAFQMTKFLARIAAINSNSLDLETVIENVFEIKKEKISAEKINEIWETGKECKKLIEYNLEDSKYTFKLTERFLPLFIELGKLTKQSLFDVMRSSSSQNVEMLLMQESLNQKKLFANKPREGEVKKRMLAPIKGGYVKEPLPGLHERIAVMDFRSLPFDEKIYLKKDGTVKIKKIGEFIEKRLSKNKNIENIEGWETLSFQDSKVCWKPITKIIKHKNDYKHLLKITTENNKKITLTPNHSIFTTDNNCELRLMNSKELKPNDYLISSKKLETEKESNELDLIEILKKAKSDETKNLMILLPRKQLPYKARYWTQKNILRELKNKKQKLKELNKKIQRHTITIRKNLNELIKKGFVKRNGIAEFTYSITLKGKEYFNSINLFKPYISTHRGWHIAKFNEIKNEKIVPELKKELFIKENNAIWNRKLPAKFKITPDLMWVIGLIISEGWIKKHKIGISTSSKKTFEKIMKKSKFFEPFYSFRRNSEYTIGIMNTPLALALKILTGERASKKHISNEFLNFPKKHRIELIKGLIEGDGCIQEKNFKYTSISKQLIEDLNMIFLSLGITSTSYISSGKIHNLYIYENFQNIKLKKTYRDNHATKLIPRKIIEKYLKKEFLRHHRGPRISTEKAIKNIDKNKKNAKLNKILTFFKNCALLRIKKIEKIKYSKPVYDLSVKDTEKFFAGNHPFLIHNSLYPSIIISHNISPETICSHKECTKNISPEGICFCEKEKGIVPNALKKVLEKRIEIKKELKKTKNETLNAKQHALKILLNSTYGTLVFPRFRWYSRECGKSITAWARGYIQNVMKKAEEQGFTSLYGDSITKDRFIPIKNKQGFIEIKNIEKLFEENSSKIQKKKGKEIIKLNGFKTLSFNIEKNKTEWQKINYLIRHKTNKKIFRVNQKLGETIATEDHSIIAEKNNEIQCIKPTEMNNAKLIRITNIPIQKKIKEIDLFEELKKYSYKKEYKKIRVSKIHLKNNFLWFGWNTQKNRIMVKRKIKVASKEFNSLCRLCGAFIAEGSTSTIETTTKKGVSISSSNKKWLEELQKDYHNLFTNVKTRIINSMKKERKLTYSNKNQTKTIYYKDKTLKLQMMNELSAVFFKVLCGQKSNGKKLPDFIFNTENKYKKMLLNKLIEGDGSRKYCSRYKKEYALKNFRIESKSLQSISGISFLLNQLNQKHTIKYRKEKDTHAISTCSNYNKRIETKINKEKYSGFVYDLEVQKNNNFVDACGNILLHNTDSNFLLVPKEKNLEDIKEFLKKINVELPGAMELEFEGFFKRGIFVTKKEGGAAKKRYALIDFNNKMKIVGFEFVRRDWAIIAKRMQGKALELILKEGNPKKAIELIKKTIKEIQEGNVSKKDLIILTQLKKPIQKYESIGPHIAAAKKAIQKGKKLTVGATLEFIITRNGKSISDKAELAEFVEEGNYDKEYYINHQIIPAVQRIIEELGYSKQDLIIGGKQQNLFSY